MNAVSPVNTASDTAPDWVADNIDLATCHAPNIEVELARLKVLKQFHLLGAVSKLPDYDMFADLACQLLDCPIACIKLVDLSRIWIVASSGAWPKHLKELPRKTSFCAHTVTLNKLPLLIVPDAQRDPRFCNFPQVTGQPYIRFYAGAPLISREGCKLGTVMAADVKPRTLSPEQQNSLVELATLVVDFMEQQAARPPMSNTGRSESSPCLVSVHDSARHESSGNTPNDVAPAPAVRNITNNNHRITRTNICTQKFINGIKYVMREFPKQVPIYYVVAPGTPASFAGDDLRLFRCAVALLTSACERTHTGRIELTLSVVINNHVCVQVLDTSSESERLVFDQQPSSRVAPDDVRECVRVDPVTGNMVQACNNNNNASSSQTQHATTLFSTGSVHLVQSFMQQLNGECGSERVEQGNRSWFSVPLV
jgi:hypothetical protein